MSGKTDNLGLRETARKYGIDPQTIRYWIKQGWVQVAQPADGPGKQMRLDEQSILQTLSRYRPHADRKNGSDTAEFRENAEAHNLQREDGLGLREAARKYGVDPQTIRYWIKQGSVNVLRESDGPGKTMVLDEGTLAKAIQSYKPRSNRIGRPLAGSGAAPPSAPPPESWSLGMPNLGWRGARRGLFATAAAAALLLMLMIPSVVYGLSVTLTPAKTTYLVGEKIDITATLAFTHPENIQIDQGGVDFVVAGPQALSVALPDGSATFTTADVASYPTYSSDPDGSGPLAVGDTIGSLSGSTSHTNFKFEGAFGYEDLYGYSPVNFGYGYGYTLGSGTSTITYDLDYTPPTLLDPAPSANIADYKTPGKFYNAPGGGGGGASNIELTKMFDLPMIPGAPPGSPVVDISYDESYSALIVLVDGPSNDVAAEISTYSGMPMYFTNVASGNQQATAVTVKGAGQWYAAVGQMISAQMTWKIVDAFDSSSFYNIQLGSGTGPTETISALMYDSSSDAFYASEMNNTGTGVVKIWKVPADGGSVTNFEVNANPTGGGYSGLVALSATSFLGANGNRAAQFDPMTYSVMSDYDFTGPGSLDTVGLAVNASESLVYVADGINQSIYSGSVPDAGTVSTTAPIAMAFRTGAETNTAFVLTDCGNSCSYDYVTEVKHGTSVAGDVKNITGGFTIAALSATGFNAPTNDVKSLAYIHPNLYTVDNTGNGSVNYLYSLDVTNSTKVGQTSSGGGWTKVVNLSAAVGDIGGMTVKGGNLVLAEEGGDNIHVVNTAGVSQGAFSMLDGVGMMYAPGGLDSITFMNSTNNYNGTNIFIGGSGNTYYQITADVGADQGTITAMDMTSGGSPPWVMTGLSSKSNVVFALDQDTGAVYKGSLPGQPESETTTAGTYTAKLVVASSNPTASTESSTSEYDIEKVTALTLAITEPLANQGYKSSDLTSGKITIEGTINDPTVTSVAVLADLPSATLLGYDAGDGKEASPFTASADQAQYKMSGLWHFTTAADAAIHDPFGPNIQSHNFLTGAYAYYGANETASAATSKPNFCTTMPGMPIPAGSTKCMVPDFMQQPSTGYFDTPAVTVSSDGDATLAFDVWWEVETAADWDNLKLQSCTGTQGSAGASCTTMAQFGATQDLPGSYSAGQVIACSSLSFYPGCTGLSSGSIIAVPNANSGGVLTSVEFLLPSTVSGSVFFRFVFDSVDAYGNHFTGILLDNIGLSGAGSLTLASATIDKSTDPPSWSLLMTPEEGENAVTISASHSAYVSGGLSASANATFFLDTAAPTVTMASLASVTATATITISGTFNEAQPKVIDIYKTVGSGSALSAGKITTFTTGQTAFTKDIVLSEGVNKIEVRMKDMAGQCNTLDSADCSTTIADSALVSLDTTAPVVTAGETGYPIGYVSARQGDLAIFQAECTDAAGFGIASVKAALPSAPSAFNQSFRTDIPGAVKDLWLSGITGGSDAAKTHLLPITVPSSVAPGTLTMNIQCEDTAGNTVDTTVSATIVSTLEGFTINLMPGDNIVSLPIIPTIASATTLAASIDTLVAGVLSPVDGEQAIEKIYYYDANDTDASMADRWSVWTAITTDTDSLTTMKAGRGYIFQMRAAAFKASASIAVGVPATQAPIAMNYLGTFLLGGQTIPPIYSVEGKDATNNPAGGSWNLIGLHSEDAELVSNYFQPLESPNRIWGSALVYRNEIVYPLTQSGTPEVVLGAFNGLVSTDYIQPGQALWLFALADGTLVPR